MDTQTNLDAHSFAVLVRQAQLDSGKSLRGKSAISADGRWLIQQAVAKIFLTETLNAVTRSHAEILMEKFETMCRRQDLRMPPFQRIPIMRDLIAELQDNALVFDVPIDKLIPATVCGGAIVRPLIKEFQDFADTPGIFKHAILHNPADPRGFLSKVRETIAALANEKEFDIFIDKPWIFKRAAVGFPSRPRRFLRALKEKNAELVAS